MCRVEIAVPHTDIAMGGTEEGGRCSLQCRIGAPAVRTRVTACGARDLVRRETGARLIGVDSVISPRLARYGGDECPRCGQRGPNGPVRRDGGIRVPVAVR